MNYLYNKKEGLFVFGVLFLLWAINLGYNCPCDKEPNQLCIRNEFYGVQFNHFLLFIFLGFLFPSFFYTLMVVGIIWEYLEYLLDKYPDFTVKYIGGCLSKPPKNFHNHQNKLYNYSVYKGIPKYLNPVDRLFNIKNSTIHAWHGSVAEIIPNFLGFYVGYSLNKIYFAKYK